MGGCGWSGESLKSWEILQEWRGFNYGVSNEDNPGVSAGERTHIPDVICNKNQVLTG